MAPQAKPTTQTVPVTPDNFIRAETDMYYKMMSNRGGSVGSFYHFRGLPEAGRVAFVLIATRFIHNWLTHTTA